MNLRISVLFMFLFALSLNVNSQIRDTIFLWPGQVPGEIEEKHPPVILDDHSGNSTRITDITNPLLLVYEAPDALKNGAAVIVCPGGGYRILSIDKEGTEIAEWLNSLGITAFVLQYRVPNKQEGALNDLQRAMRLVRGNKDVWGLDPNKIGVIGFSAGGSLSARACSRYNEQTYQAIDDHDKLSSKPDFAMLIYPAYLDHGENKSITPEIRVDSLTPPMFLFCTADDNHSNSSIVMAGELKKNKLPFELHILPEGRHGYGMREGNPAAEAWPANAEAWLKKIIFEEEEK